MRGAGAELFAVRRDFAVDTRRAHALSVVRWSKSPAARLAAAAGVGKALSKGRLNETSDPCSSSCRPLALAACNTQHGEQRRRSSRQPGSQARHRPRVDGQVRSRRATTSTAMPTASWVKNDADPGRPVEHRRLLSSPTRAREEHARAVRRRSSSRTRPRARTRRGSPIITTAYIEHRRDRPRGLAPAKADLDAIAAIADKRALSAAIGGTLRADTDPLNATNFSDRESVRHFRHAGPRRRRRAAALSHAGRHRPAGRANIISRPMPKMAEIRDKYTPYVATDPAARRPCPTPQARAQTDHRPRDQDRPGAASRARRARTCRQRRDKSVDPQPTSSRRRRGSTGPRCFGAAQLGSAQKFDAYHLAPSDPEARRRWSRRSRCDAGRTGSPSTTINQQANVLPKRVPRRAVSRSTERRSPARRSSGRATSWRSTLTSDALQDAVGKAYVDKYFPASSKAEIQGMVDNIKAAFAQARRRRSTGWRRRPSRKR